MNEAGGGRGGNKWTQAGIGGVVIGASLLLWSEEAGAPSASGDDSAPPHNPQAREPREVPEPGFGLMQLSVAPEAFAAAEAVAQKPEPLRPPPRETMLPPMIAAEDVALAGEQVLAGSRAAPVAAPAVAEPAPVVAAADAGPPPPVAIEAKPAPVVAAMTAPTPSAAPPAPAVHLALAEVTSPQPHRSFEQAPPAAPATEHLALPKPSFGSAPSAKASPGLPGAALSAAPGSPMAGFFPAAPFTADDELILQFDTAHGEVSETVIAYGTRSGVYLPLGELARLLDLAVTISDDGHYAAGWVLDEKHGVAISLRQGTIRHDGVETALSPRDAAAFEGELYLRAERFADLMPLALKVDLRAQTIAVKTQVPFPFEQRAAREAAREHLATRSERRDPRGYPREETPWRVLAVPLADVELRGVSDSTFGTRGEGDVRLAGDLALMTARVFASASSRDGLTAARIELGRRDPDARLLGPLRATEFQLGDVSTMSLPLGLRGIAGRGGFVTNTPLERASVFDKIDLRGELPAGYEVEVYRNNTLVGSTRIAVNGQYEFLQVPVEFGLNVFRLVLYGPQGQRREQVRRISVGDGRLGKGELLYSVGVAQKDVNLLDAHAPGFVPSQDFGAWRATAQLQYGLTTGLTTVIGGGWYQSGGTTHWLVSGGLRTGIGGMATRLDYASQDGKGRAVSAGIGGKLGPVNFTASHSEYFGTFSDELRALAADPLRRASEADTYATIHYGPADSPHNLPIAARVRRIEFADGRVQMDASLRASQLVSRLLVSNSLGYTRSSAPGTGAFSQLTGTFDLATLAGSRTQGRVSLDYALLPNPQLTAAQLEIDRSFGPDTLVKASVARLLATGETSFGLSAVRRFERFSLAFDGNVVLPRRTYAATLRLGFSLGRNPITGAGFIARPGLAQSGAVAVRAWEDENGNRRYDPGETVLPQVEFGTASVSARTDRHGVALLGGIGDGVRTGLHLNGETLPDIAMAPVSEGIEIIPRAGRIHVSGFAVEALSDLEGSASFGNNGREVSGLKLQLVNRAGKVVARTRTGGGGAYLFEQVHPGDYRIEIEPAQAGRLGIRLETSSGVHVGGKSAVVRTNLRVSAAN